jgi:hypothetical protein
MNEEEWLRGDDVGAMLAFLRGKGSDRKFLLFACACCRRIWPYLPNAEARRFVEVTERRADQILRPGDEAAGDEFSDADYDRSTGYHDYVYSYATGAVDQLGHQDAWEAASGSSHPAGYAELTATGALAQVPTSGIHKRLRPQADLLRDIFGNPFHPVVLDPAWLTADVLLLARGIYEERAFDRMPILADALQDAGCDNEDVLNHCRDAKQVHVSGCWVVDLVLGKR